VAQDPKARGECRRMKNKTKEQYCPTCGHSWCAETTNEINKLFGLSSLPYPTREHEEKK